MGARGKRLLAIRDLLALHSAYTFSDMEQNMIECVCGWRSAPFLPEPLMVANDVYAGHQVDVLSAAGLI